MKRKLLGCVIGAYIIGMLAGMTIVIIAKTEPRMTEAQLIQSILQDKSLTGAERMQILNAMRLADEACE